MRFEFSDALIFFSKSSQRLYFNNNIFVFQSFLIGFDGFIFGKQGRRLEAGIFWGLPFACPFVHSDSL